MERTVAKIEALEDRLRGYKVHSKAAEIALQPDLFAAEDEDDDDLTEAFQVGSKLKFEMAHLDVDRWLKDLATDKQQLSLLSDAAKAVDPTRDAKLAKLKELIEKKVRHPHRNNHGEENRKVIVFCAFADTAAYLYEALETWARKTVGLHIALVSGGSKPNRTTFGKAEFSQILTNFSPRSKHRDEN